MKKSGHQHAVTSAATIITSTGSVVPPSGATGAGSPPSGQVVLGSGATSDFGQTVVSGGPAADLAPSGLPERIGHYRILRLIGAGGMGAVYEAEQDNPRRTVALKVMRGAIASPQASRRFEYESQLLARLRHPSIAQVYEAGTQTEPITGAAMPFFAMEFIPDAKTLTDYADAVGLGLKERVELFIEICDAVQHGHQRGVIHRDLKPANILIDSAGHPKIIDFGVARASEEGADEPGGAEHQTKAGQLIGTLQYMSPEQCGQDSNDIDVRADVYALGVILFELLTGALPHNLDGTALFAAVMIIRDDAPKQPSAIKRELRGDLDTIILKALEKDRVRRYGSAAELAADLGRHLRDEPILARQIGVAGRMVRWVKRNRAVATVISISTVLLVTTSIVLIARILRESARANAALVQAELNLNAANRESARATNALAQAELNLRAAKDNFSLTKTLFGSMRPNDQERGLVDVQQVLDNAARQLIEQPPQLEGTEADFREIIAGGYQGLGLYAKSVLHQKRVVDLRMKLSSKEDLGLADSLHQYAAALWWNGQYDEAAPIYEHSLAIRKKLLGNEHADVAMSYTHLAACKLKQDHLDEATSYYRQALEMRKKLQGQKSPEVAAGINNLAKCEALAGDFEIAEKHFLEAIAMISQLRGENDLATATAQLNLAGFMIEAGKYDTALEKASAALATRQKKLSANHHFVLVAKLVVARAKLGASADPAVKLQLARDAAAVFASLETVLKPEHADEREHPDVTEASGQVGFLLVMAGDTEEGMRLLRRAEANVNANTHATRRDRNEAGLRLAIAKSAAGESGGPASLFDLMVKLQPGQVSNSLRVAAFAMASPLAKSQAEQAVVDRWRTAGAAPK